MADTPTPSAGEAPLRHGWTTGACATAAAAAALHMLRRGYAVSPQEITLPGGDTVAFALASASCGEDEDGPWGQASVIKDAGDDPDVTHGAEIIATVRQAPPGSGVVFRAGTGVGTVTKPGLPLAVGEPAINPVPRQMIQWTLAAIESNQPPVLTGHLPLDIPDAPRDQPMPALPDLCVEISVPDGLKLAPRTWNPRLGILGGISILGTTGIVVPYSCSAWIHSIQRGIDVARAGGVSHIAGCVGNTSEKAVCRLYPALGEDSIIDMGDFVGGMLKYLRQNPVPRVTIAGGFAKLSKLAAGHLDLHSKRSQVDTGWLAGLLQGLGAGEDVIARARTANTALEILELSRAGTLPLGEEVARLALTEARRVLRETPLQLEIAVFDRQGSLVGLAQED